MAQTLVRAPLVDQAIAMLREQISDGEWPVGARLPAEPVLAQQMGVGRSTIREAVRVLSHAGILEVHQGSGTFVRSATTPDDFATRLHRAKALEVYEVRRGLEVEAAALAAVRRTDDDLAAIDQALAERNAAAADRRSPEFLAGDINFHKAVVDAAHNPLLSALYASSIAAIRRALEDVLADASVKRNPHALHEELARAIRRQDQRAAVAAVRRHLDGTYEALARLVRS